MSLEPYFNSLIEKVEASSEITNAGKDKEGFFLPTRSVLLQKLHMLKDLHAKKNAKPMVRDAWQFVVEHLPAEWLVLDKDQKAQVKAMLA
jgi:hypothetical protein